MLRQECIEKLIAKLTSARYELEDALKVATPVGRYDPSVLSGGMREKIGSIINDLDRLLHNLEGMQ
jgi:hypothetical protein